MCSCVCYQGMDLNIFLHRNYHSIFAIILNPLRHFIETFSQPYPYIYAPIFSEWFSRYRSIKYVHTKVHIYIHLSNLSSFQNWIKSFTISIKQCSYFKNVLFLPYAEWILMWVYHQLLTQHNDPSILIKLLDYCLSIVWLPKLHKTSHCWNPWPLAQSDTILQTEQMK